MSALGQQAADRIREYPDVGQAEPMRGKGEFRSLAPFRRISTYAVGTSEANSLAPSLTMRGIPVIHEALAGSTPAALIVSAGDAWARQPEPPIWVLFWGWHERREGAGSGSLGGRTSDALERIDLAAEKYARSVGMYGSLVLTKQILREKMGSAMAALNVNLREDPDSDGYITICFTVTLRVSVDQALELDDALQETLIERIPPNDRICLSFSYDFK